ncbi:MAG TPA: prolipoprotein diacylglyceryl transferase [Cyclobacteriaceae bacterium]|jgi:prolipoprotein diacylglyceryl transferase|nr:prolipoprotein diacylglyceryl transferase [Cyclobacteriaceae bacterium]
MAILNYIIWNGSPEIFSIGTFSLRWYGLFFAVGFLLSQQILYYMFRKEGKPEKDVETLTIYMVIATILGARLGHVIFYQPEMIWTEPLSIFLPFEFSPFRFTGLQGLASHGAAIGILTALWLYSRKKKAGQNFLQIVDRIVILVALCGALIRFGNYFNSEIIGKPTDKEWGVMFVNRLTEYVENKQVDTNQIVETLAYVKNDSLPPKANGNQPIFIYIFFKPNTTLPRIANFINSEVKNSISYRLNEYFDQGIELSLPYDIKKEKTGNYVARIKTYGIPRHPSQLYESISCVILFILLFAIWNKHKAKLPAGRLLGIFLIVCFGLRFIYEFLKENQVTFENNLPINMGQILSIPLVLAGFVVLFISFKKKPDDGEAVKE